MPWAYVRRRLAERWHVPPWVVDEAPVDEIALELKLSEIEAGTRRRTPAARKR